MGLSDFWKENYKKDLDFGRQLAAKALDVPLKDDMNITQIKSGISTAAFLGAIFLTGGLATGIPLLMNFLQQPTSIPIPVKPIDSEYEVRHYNIDGELIKIPQKDG